MSRLPANLSSARAAASNTPGMSVIIATYNERSCIRQCLTSLLKQDRPELRVEILVVDGGSTDGTQQIVAALAANDSRIRLLHNPRRAAPSAFNIGVAAARAEFVAILGAHALYPANYLATCLEELRATQAVGCSGKIKTLAANQSLSARICAWTVAHPFASSGHSVRTQRSGFVDTIPFPVFRKQTLLELGGYDESLHRNQDNDMNQRLRAAGYRLYLTGKVQSTYFARPTVRELLRYAFLSGRWNAFSLRRNRRSMGIRHFVPLAFALSLIILVFVVIAATPISPLLRNYFLASFAVLLCSHFLLGFAAAIHVAIRERSFGALLMPFVIFGFHFAYGLGTAIGLCRSRTSATRETDTTSILDVQLPRDFTKQC